MSVESYIGKEIFYGFDGTNTDRIAYTIMAEDDGKEVQLILKDKIKMASGMIKILKYNKGLILDGEIVRGTAKARKGQTLVLYLNCQNDMPNIEPPAITPESGYLDVIYEDDAFIVINKPANTVIHPTCSHQTGTLLNYLMYHWQRKGILTDAHLVGRLDKDTTGIVIIARNGYVQEHLKQQSANKIMKKYYIAAVAPAPECDEGTIDAPIMRDYDSIIKRKISAEGARAITHYKVFERHKCDIETNIESIEEAERTCFAIAEFLIETGRTHQIRLHSSYSGFPIIGDTLYGNDEWMHKAPHQLLHAYKVEIVHPITGENMTFKAKPPKEWGEFCPKSI